MAHHPHYSQSMRYVKKVRISAGTRFTVELACGHTSEEWLPQIRRSIRHGWKKHCPRCHAKILAEFLK